MWDWESWKVLSLGEQRSSAVITGGKRGSERRWGPQLWSIGCCWQLAFLALFCPGPALSLRLRQTRSYSSRVHGTMNLKTSSKILWHSSSKVKTNSPSLEYGLPFMAYFKWNNCDIAWSLRLGQKRQYSCHLVLSLCFSPILSFPLSFLLSPPYSVSWKIKQRTHWPDT